MAEGSDQERLVLEGYRESIKSMGLGGLVDEMIEICRVICGTDSGASTRSNYHKI